MLIKLKDVCTIKSSKRIFEKEYVKSGIPFIRGKEITDKSILNPSENFECYISKERYEEIKETYGVPQIGDILMTAVGTVGNACYINKQIDFYYKDGNVIQFTNFSKNVNSKYLYFFFNSSLFTITLNNILIGAVQKALTMDMLREIEIDLPTREMQDKIANILSNIDNQIERNNAMTKRLQVLAQTTYSRWFNQFEFPNNEGKPYKSNGGELVYNKELGKEIPVDWQVKQLKDITKCLLGGTPSRDNSNYWNGNIHWINSGEVASFPVLKTEETISQLGLDNSATKLLPIGSIVISITGNIRFSILSIESCANQSVVGVLENENIKKSFLYFVLKDYENIYTSKMTGAVQKHINKEVVETSYILIPPEKILNSYYIVNEAIINRIVEISKNTEHLIILKERLLPLLINGQLNI